jgi:hypothetical protein
MVGMSDAWVRVERAKGNFKRLKDDIAEFRRLHPNMHTVGMDQDGKGHVKLIAKVQERPPNEWGLASGDILVDLRCALDYAVYALAIAHSGQDPPPSADRLEFPICETEKRWKQAIGRRKLDGLSSAAVDYIASVQPYQPTHGGQSSGLFILDELVGINKHRFIHVAWVKLKALSLQAIPNGLNIQDFVGYQISGELKDGAVLATFHVVATQKHAQLQIGASLTTFEAIEPTEKGWIDLNDFLWKATIMVEQYVGAMEATL